MERICFNCFKPCPSPFCAFCGYKNGTSSQQHPLALKEGSVVGGKYVIGRVLGEGGFGITYIAQDFQSKELVAVKEFFPDALVTRTNDLTVSTITADRRESFEYGKAAFLKEAETLAQFNGKSNIVRVYTYFEENNTAYFAMEFLNGETLLNKITRSGNRLGWSVLEEIVLQAADALSEVHSKGIIHRDISPDNIFICSDGSVKLIDFGAARYSLGDRSKSLSMILKQGYAPKEQYFSHSKQGPFTDVYALAATIYRALTGQAPQISIERVENDMIIPLSPENADVPKTVADVVMKALSVQPEDRYQTVAEFKKALTDASENTSQAAQPTVAPYNPNIDYTTGNYDQYKTESAEKTFNPVQQTFAPAAQPITQATQTTQAPRVSEKPKSKKPLIIIIIAVAALICAAGITAVVFLLSSGGASSSKYIVDNAGVLSNEDMKSLSEKIETLNDKFGITAAIITTNDTGGKELSDYSTEVCEEKGFTENKCIYTLNTSNSESSLARSGKLVSETVETDDSAIINDVMSAVAEGDYYKAFSAFLNDIEKELTEGSDSDSGSTDSGLSNDGDAGSDGFGDEENVTLNLWVSDAYLDLARIQCDRFTEEHSDKNITVNVSVASEAEAGTMVLNDGAAAADVFSFACDQIDTLIDGNALVPLSEDITYDIKTTNTQTSTAACENGGKMYAFPMTGNGYFLYYDKSVVSDSDAQSLEDVLEACKKSNKKFIMDCSNGYYSCMFVFTGGLSLDGTDYSDSQLFNDYNEDDVVDTMQAFSKLMHKYKGTFTNESANNIPAGFSSGTCGAGIDGNWDSEAIKDALGDNMGAAKLPTINVNGIDKQIISMYGYKLFGVNSHSDYPLTAMQLAYYLSSEQCQNERAEELGWSPTNMTAAESDASQSDDTIRALTEQSRYSVPQVDIAPTFWNIMANIGTSLFDGEADCRSLLRGLTD